MTMLALCGAHFKGSFWPSQHPRLAPRVRTHTVTRNGETYEQNTANIGKSSSSDDESEKDGVTLPHPKRAPRTRDKRGKLAGISGTMAARGGFGCPCYSVHEKREFFLSVAPA